MGKELPLSQGKMPRAQAYAVLIVCSPLITKGSTLFTTLISVISTSLPPPQTRNQPTTHVSPLQRSHRESLRLKPPQLLLDPLLQIWQHPMPPLELAAPSLQYTVSIDNPAVSGELLRRPGSLA
ncbi:hypothetical protein PMIN06_006062 [Paraphaeosphaeria minitans]